VFGESWRERELVRKSYNFNNTRFPINSVRNRDPENADENLQDSRVIKQYLTAAKEALADDAELKKYPEGEKWDVRLTRI